MPQSKPQITIAPSEPGAAPVDAGNTRFTLTRVAIEGANVLAASSFEPLYRPLLDKQVSLADVYALRDAITAEYRSEGYILSHAEMPPQTIDGGVVHIRVVEGGIGSVSVEGDGATGLIRAMAERIRTSRPLNVRDLERYTLLIDDLPGITVSTVLKPSATEGDADLVVKVSRKTADAFLSADNRGSRAIGPFEAAAGVTFNSLLGLNEAASVLLAGAPSNELKYIAGRYVQPLGPEGVRLTISGAYSHSRPGGSLATLDGLGIGKIVSVAIEAPVIRSRAETLRLGLAATLQDSRTDLLRLRFSDDRVRYLTANLSYDASDTVLGSALSASNLVRVEFSQGIDALGARRTGSSDLSRVNGHSDFTLVYGEITRVQRLGGPFSIAISDSGQYAFVPLLSSQQFGLGGRRFGRGYEPSELTGDNGIAASVEARFDLPIGGSIAAQLYAFYEGGKVWQKHPLTGQPSSDALSSAGAGIRFTLFNRVSAAFELAKPLTHDIASRGDRHWRPLFDLSVSF